MSQLERIRWIDAEIRAGHYPNAARVSEEFEVTRRTAYADRNHLISRMGAPLATDPSGRGWVYTEPSFMLPFLALSQREAGVLRRTFLSARRYLAPTDAEEVARIAERLQPFMVPALPAGHEQVRGSMQLSRLLSPEMAAACEQAVASRQRLQILYYSVRRDETAERIVQPYELLLWRGEPHLIAFCELRGDIRQFFLGRVREWRLLEGDAAFARQDFDVEAYLRRGLDLQHGDEMVTVRVRFSPYQARWIRERRYHESQTTEELPDGSLLLTVRVAGTDEMRRWLLGYGGEAEVLEPERLRLEISTEAKKLQKMYGAEEK